jgi:hypothetical protein
VRQVGLIDWAAQDVGVAVDGRVHGL